MWLYQFIISDQIRAQYNLNVSATNDVSAPIFDSIREDASLVLLTNFEPQGKLHLLFVVSVWFAAAAGEASNHDTRNGFLFLFLFSLFSSKANMLIFTKLRKIG